MLVKKITIRSYEVGLKFRDGEFNRILSAGKHWIIDPWNRSEFEWCPARSLG